MKNKLVLDSFVLKIVALISMTIDHIANFAYMYVDINMRLYTFLKIIGRISFVLFLFCSIESILKTTHKKQYIIRLGIMSVLAYIVVGFLNSPLFNYGYYAIQVMNVGNIFIDLFMSSLIILFLLNKKIYVKLLSILPALYLMGGGILKYLRIDIISVSNLHNLYDGLLGQYDFLTVILAFGIYFSYYFYDKYCKKVFANDLSLYNAYKESPDYRWKQNIILSILIVLISVICYLFGRFSNIPSLITYFPFEIESYMVLAIPFILFYSGNKGKSNKIIKYGFYAYYPLHLLVLFLIFCFI